eukprot:2920776-Pyramimonas_sp.AAC.1
MILNLSGIMPESLSAFGGLCKWEKSKTRPCIGQGILTKPSKVALSNIALMLDLGQAIETVAKTGPRIMDILTYEPSIVGSRFLHDQTKLVIGKPNLADDPYLFIRKYPRSD